MQLPVLGLEFEHAGIAEFVRCAHARPAPEVRCRSARGPSWPVRAAVGSE